MRSAPKSRVILSDDEIAAQMRADGLSNAEIKRRRAVHAEASARAQSDYDSNRMMSANDRHVREVGAALIEEAKRAAMAAEEAE
jgi:hypothetical protein